MDKREMEVVKMATAGRRSAGGGQRIVTAPRGVEVLVKKAAVDEEFRGMLLAKRGAAAAAIGLELDPAEAAMLSTISEEHLARIIDQTVVPTEHRRVFLGKMAAAMLTAIGVGLVLTDEDVLAQGGGRAALASPPPPRTDTPTTDTAPATSVGRFYGSGASGGAGPGRISPPSTTVPRGGLPGGGQYELPPQPASQPAPPTGVP